MDVIVVKVGGEVLENNLEGVMADIAKVVRGGRKIIIVHGGGKTVSRYSLSMGIKPVFVSHPNGGKSRYTTEDELKVYVMSMAGLINKEIVASLFKRGVKAVGLSGADASLLTGRRRKRILIIDERGRKRVIPGGFTGKIIKVNTELLDILLKAGIVPVISPIAIDKDGTLLNVDADQASSSVASFMNAEVLILLTDVEGVFIDDALAKELRGDELPNLIEKIGLGMNRKLVEAHKACKGGVGQVIISPGLGERPLSKALHGLGTRIICEGDSN